MATCLIIVMANGQHPSRIIKAKGKQKQESRKIIGMDPSLLCPRRHYHHHVVFGLGLCLFQVRHVGDGPRFSSFACLILCAAWQLCLYRLCLLLPRHHTCSFSQGMRHGYEYRERRMLGLVDIQTRGRRKSLNLPRQKRIHTRHCVVGMQTVCCDYVASCVVSSISSA